MVGDSNLGANDHHQVPHNLKQLTNQIQISSPTTIQKSLKILLLLYGQAYILNASDPLRLKTVILCSTSTHAPSSLKTNACNCSTVIILEIKTTQDPLVWFFGEKKNPPKIANT